MGNAELGDELNTKSYALAKEITGGDDKWHWTGWKDSTEEFIVDGKYVRGHTGMFAGQWLDWHNLDDLYYVNLPSFDCGPYKRGGEFTVGRERITVDTTWEQIEKMIRDGFRQVATRGVSDGKC